MVMKIVFKIPFILALFFIGQISYASLYYIVMRGDTLSEIALSHYPEMRIYGSGGSLEKLLKFNPEIKDPDLIFVGQKVKFSNKRQFSETQNNKQKHQEHQVFSRETDAEVTSEQSRIKEEEQNLATKNEEKKGYILDRDESGIFDLSLGMGAYYYSHSQSRVLGDANIGALFLNKLSLSTSYRKGNFKFEAGATSYEFKYVFSGNESKRRMYETDLKLFYRSLFIGGRLEQKPLFKNSNGQIEMVAETFVIPTFGLEFDFLISDTIPTFLMLRPSVSYFMDSSSSETSVKLSDQSGYGADLDIILRRKLNTSARFPTYYFWSNNFSYRKFERDVSWGNSIGSVETKYIDYNSTIGLMVEF